MPKIEVLSQQTIDQIAAGEVIERPASVVKELVENAIDAKSGAITVEIKEGGCSLIRVTDNGFGIEKEQIALAFLRHSTSKIRCVEDLLSVTSLGFRGEALSSIAAVSQVELITKTRENISGTRYLIEGGVEKGIEEIGAPDGTTFLVRNLFYNTPARRKFLKSPSAEGAVISDLMEHMALSHPEISFQLLVDNKPRFHTSGSGDLREVIYSVYGRDIASNILKVHREFPTFTIDGYIGKPLISRGNRNFENYFVNGRYVKSHLVARAIEDGYQSFVMQHKYPFTVLLFTMSGSEIDVNVHPTKMELRFRNQEVLFEAVRTAIRETINAGELVYRVPLEKASQEEAVRETSVHETAVRPPEPFEKHRLDEIRASIHRDSPYEKKYGVHKPSSVTTGSDITGSAASDPDIIGSGTSGSDFSCQSTSGSDPSAQSKPGSDSSGQSTPDPDTSGHGTSDPPKTEQAGSGIQMELFLSKEAIADHRILGQLFETYWLVEYRDQLYIIDQHAAHEKVLYERTMASLKTRDYPSQRLLVPIILSLTMQEEELICKHRQEFEKIGFFFEHFGGRDYAVTGVPANLFNLNEKDLLVELLDQLSQEKGTDTSEILLEKIASMSCKAAVKGNQTMSVPEAKALIDELLTLENPYHCPHGRPVIIAITKRELEKKFKRVL